jgi:hypothetical protein
MDYDLAIDNAPASVPGGTALLLVHPSIGETDRVDTDFLNGGTDRFLVISTRTTAREVEQKLDYYEVDEQNAVILDTLSVERGYSRRSAPHIHYASGPDDVSGIVEHVEEFFTADEGRHRLTFDSLTELAYYADEDRALDVAKRLVDLIKNARRCRAFPPLQRGPRRRNRRGVRRAVRRDGSTGRRRERELRS